MNTLQTKLKFSFSFPYQFFSCAQCQIKSYPMLGDFHSHCWPCWQCTNPNPSDIRTLGRANIRCRLGFRIWFCFEIMYVTWMRLVEIRSAEMQCSWGMLHERALLKGFFSIRFKCYLRIWPNNGLSQKSL